MYRDTSIAVVVPAFNEERAIAATLDRVPGFVDRVILVDDASTDATASAAAGSARAFELLRHERNRGVGAAIVSGYRRALALGLDAVVVMAGDGQMDPADLPALLDPLVEGRGDYIKGDRFRHPELWRAMPATRIAGNVLLSLATRCTSGYRHVFDSQCGYTAINRRALEAVALHRVFTRYGYPNDMLARLHAVGMRVVDVPVRPIYGPEWKSGIKARTVIYPVGFVLVRSWVERLLAERRPAISHAPGPAAGQQADHGGSRARRRGDDVVSPRAG